MAVLAKYERALLTLFLQELLHALNRGVHLAHHIKHVIGRTVKAVGAFVVYGAGAVKGLDQLCALAEIRSPAALVSQ